LLQQKRLEFAKEKETNTSTSLIAAKSNFNKCVSEIQTCYNYQTATNGWSPTRVKSYCAQVAEIPSCYEPMVCNQDAGAVIDVEDSTTCVNSNDWSKNTCRNVVRVYEILNKAADVEKQPTTTETNSAAMREYCLMRAPGVATEEGSIRKF
jgi:hypothetical protein